MRSRTRLNSGELASVIDMLTNDSLLGARRIRRHRKASLIVTRFTYIHQGASVRIVMDHKGQLTARQMEAMYVAHFDNLARVATSEFHIPEEAAASLAHDVLVASMRHATSISDIDEWLRGAIAFAAKKHIEAPK